MAIVFWLALEVDQRLMNANYKAKTNAQEY